MLTLGLLPQLKHVQRLQNFPVNSSVHPFMKQYFVARTH